MRIWEILSLPVEAVNRWLTSDDHLSLDDGDNQENVTLQYPPEYLLSQSPLGMPPAKLKGRSGQVVKVSDRGWSCQAFESSTTEGPAK
ncbi:hypothetical protein TNCV_2724641 [Trichonephila clavipes]|nr:hypothetical protein TNCV_2724641 [Trichonephila clavipes]